MVTKVSAARLAARSGAHTVIVSGHGENVLSNVLEGKAIGTLLTADMTPMTARKRWIAGQLKAKGDVVVDDGAAGALARNGVSLLAVGVTSVRGDFSRGDVVRVVDKEGSAIAQGLSNYSSAEMARLAGVKSEDFPDHIDYVGEPELIHRDNLVLV